MMGRHSLVSNDSNKFQSGGFQSRDDFEAEVIYISPACRNRGGWGSGERSSLSTLLSLRSGYCYSLLCLLAFQRSER
jgi:hypothetical protein